MPGSYEVYAHIPFDWATTHRAVYEIQHRGGEAQVIVDQWDYSNDWAKLGRFVLDEGAIQCVVLTNNTDEPGLKTAVGFDAIKWVFAGEE